MAQAPNAPIDYEKIAREHGGKVVGTVAAPAAGGSTPPPVDYDAIAQQVREAATTPGKSVDGSMVDTVLSLLPAAGGVAGGILGGIGGTVGGFGVGGVPGAIGGATLGGAFGESVRQLANRARGAPAPSSAREAASGIATQAAIQGGGEVVGAGLGRVAAKASPWLMNRALNLTAKLSREFPHLSDTMIEHALTVSQGGLAKARVLLQAAKGKANAALAQAQAAGATVPISAATDGLQRTLVDVLNSADVEGGLFTLAAVERRIGGGRAGTLTPTAADALKRSLQTESKSLYAAVKMGQGKPNVSVRAQALADMAASLNEGIGTVTTQAGAAGYREANASAAELIGAVWGITTGIRPGANLYQAMVRPGVGAVIGGVTGAETGGTKGAIAGTAVGSAILSPLGMSRLAVTLAKPSVQAILRHSPRLAAAVASLAAIED